MSRQYLVWLGLLCLTSACNVSAAFRSGHIPKPKLSEVDWNSYYDRDENGPGTYSFGYDVEDPATGNTQFRQEERFPNGTVEGSYGLQESDGNVRTVHYTADHLGYRVRIENSIRKNEDYPPRPISPVTVAPSWITQKPPSPQLYSKVSPPEYIYNSVENPSVPTPQLRYYGKKFYPYYFRSQPVVIPSPSNSIYYS